LRCVLPLARDKSSNVARIARPNALTAEKPLVRKILVAASAFACATWSAFAQEPPRTLSHKPAPFGQIDRWSGPYAGLVAGLAEGHSSPSSTVGCPVGGFLCAPGQYLDNGALLSATATGPTSNDAFSVGALAGYNWHGGSVVYGIEGDVSSLHLSLNRGGSASSLNLGLTNPGPVPVVATVNATAQIDWLATIRGRIGYLVSPDFLVYATGGLALTNLTVSNSYTDNWVFNGGAIGNSSVTSNATGYAVGGGVEWGLGGRWTLRADYLRVGFGSVTTSGMITVVQVPAAQNPFTSSANLTANLFRSGLIYKF
jgi:outer membrane immunogenic protein